MSNYLSVITANINNLSLAKSSIGLKISGKGVYDNSNINYELKFLCIQYEFVDVDGWDETPVDGVPLKSVYTADLHHTTIKVLQEAMSKIETQQCTINTLKTCLGII
jgi:hypothetical protein